MTPSTHRAVIGGAVILARRQLNRRIADLTRKKAIEAKKTGKKPQPLTPAEIKGAITDTRRYLDRELPQLTNLPKTEGYGDPAVIAALRPIFEAFSAALDKLGEP